MQACRTASQSRVCSQLTTLYVHVGPVDDRRREVLPACLPIMHPADPSIPHRPLQQQQQQQSFPCSTHTCTRIHTRLHHHARDCTRDCRSRWGSSQSDADAPARVDARSATPPVLLRVREQLRCEVDADECLCAHPEAPCVSDA